MFRDTNKIDKKFLAFSLFSTVLLGITPSVSLLLTQSIINGIQTGVYSFSQVVGLIIVYVACNALVSLFTIFSQYYTSVFQYKLNKTINIMILDKAGKLSFKSFENPEAYNKIQRAQTSNKIYPFISYILSIIQLSITLYLMAPSYFLGNGGQFFLFSLMLALVLFLQID